MSSSKKSPVWLHFTDVEGQNHKASCNHCKKVVAYHMGSSSNLRRHLTRAHSEMLAGTTEVETSEKPSQTVWPPNEGDLDDAIASIVKQEDLPVRVIIKRARPVVRPPAPLVTSLKKRNLSKVVYAKPHERLVQLKPIKTDGTTVRAFVSNSFTDDGNVREIYTPPRKPVQKMVYVDDSNNYVSSVSNEDIPQEYTEHIEPETSIEDIGEPSPKKEKPDLFLEGLKYKTDAKLRIAREKLEFEKMKHQLEFRLKEEKERNRHAERMMKLEICKIKVLRENKPLRDDYQPLQEEHQPPKKVKQ